MLKRSETDHLSLAAILSAAAMIAFQVGGKAARDALFLTSFPVTSLPGMLIASSALSIFAVLATARAISTLGPGALIPYGFGASSILLLVEWGISAVAPKTAAVVFYLHMAAFGAILISGFWSLIGELFDPRTAKARVGRIAAGGTLGGLLGGVLAERTGAILSVNSMLPVLAALHFACALLNRRLQPPKASQIRSLPAESGIPPARSGIGVLLQAPYLRNLARLLLLGTVAETLLDFVFKTQASAAFNEGEQLMRFFALFYTGISLLTFLVQSSFSRYSLQQFGLTRTMSTMPIMVAAGGFGSLIWPGLLSIGFVRGGQSVLRSSLFRSGYELLYTPVSRGEKRAAKTIVDVGFDRIGDAVGGALISSILFLGFGASLNSQLLILVAVVLGGLSLGLTARLSKGYVATLEKSLLDQAAELELIDTEERTTRATLLRTLGTVDLSVIRSHQKVAVPTPQPEAHETEIDDLVKRIIGLRSQSSVVVRAELSRPEPLDPLLVSHAIRLLAHDEVCEDAMKALRTVGATAVGQLTDALLDQDEDFAIRRRIPRILAGSATARAVEGLLRGLNDRRFEVRFNCGRALSKICSADPRLCPPADSIYAAALEEIEAAKRLAEPPKILDRYEDHSDLPASDADVWNSTDFRLEHIFRLLSLCLPKEPLHVAFQALHTNDEYLKGTALEYLESILPSPVRENLWQFLEGPSRPAPVSRPPGLVLEELMQSRQSILRKSQGG